MREKPIPRPVSSIVHTVFVAALLLSVICDARAGDAERGQLLYENHCTVCHASIVHIREDRKASTREDIRSWIERWKTELGLQWTSGEVDDVLEYLDNRYYKIKSAS